MHKMKIVPMSAMEKLLPGNTPKACSSIPSAPQNGRLCFQIAFTSLQKMTYDAPLLTVHVESTLPCVKLYKEEFVPCTLPAYYDADDEYITKTQSLIPDRLILLEKGGTIRLLYGYWQTLWAEAYKPDGLPAGTHTVTLRFCDASGAEWGREEIQVQVKDIMLEPQTFLHTEWLHLDCICQAHRCKPFSKRFWRIAEEYLSCQTQHGINVAWVPVFTPPLDTAQGRDRMTVQMVDVKRENGEYVFDFSVLEKWLELCRSLGFCRFEFSHLFTQWGALHCPKIMVEENGEAKKAFGWNTNADSEEYRTFLNSFLPELRRLLIKIGIWKSSIFHLSDEPVTENEKSYLTAKSIVKGIVSDIPLWETLSDYSLYENGLVEHPVPSIDKAGEFYKRGTENFWVYYSCVNGADCPNRFLSMPLSRVRDIGKTAVLMGACGFLHWGFNFWNTQHSLSPVDPCVVTDAGGAFPSGDAFVVYPGNDAPYPSMRLKMLALAMEDTRKSAVLSDSGT